MSHKSGHKLPKVSVPFPPRPPVRWGDPPLMTHSERRLLPFPMPHVYHVVSSVDEYSSFVPWCVGSSVLQQVRRGGQQGGGGGGGGGALEDVEAELAVGFQLFSERYVSRVTLDPQRSVTAVASGTLLFSHLVNVWRFEPGPDPHTTWLDFGVEFQFRSHLYATASSLFFDEVVLQMVNAFEKRCKDTQGKGKWKEVAIRGAEDGGKGEGEGGTKAPLKPVQAKRPPLPPPLKSGIW
jgi:coenzyme Q-binding protein COQ10